MWVAELDQVALRGLAVGPADNNAYLVTCLVTGAQLLVDAAAEPDRLLALVHAGSPGGRLDVVVTTHRHADHHGGLASLLAVTGARHACGAADADAVPVGTDVRLHHGDVVRVGDARLDVIALAGHTPGGVALAYAEPATARAPGAVPGRTHLFTGDSLFPGGPGRTTSTDDFTRLMTDLAERVFVLPDDTVVHPGHGRPTTLGAERPHLAEWWTRGW